MSTDHASTCVRIYFANNELDSSLVDEVARPTSKIWNLEGVRLLFWSSEGLAQPKHKYFHRTQVLDGVKGPESAAVILLYPGPRAHAAVTLLPLSLSRRCKHL